MTNSVDPYIVPRQSECGQCLREVRECNRWRNGRNEKRSRVCYSIDLQCFNKRLNAFMSDVTCTNVQCCQCLERVQLLKTYWTQAVLISPDWPLRHHWENGHLEPIFCSIEDPSLSVSAKSGNGAERIEIINIIVLLYWSLMPRQDIESLRDSIWSFADSVFSRTWKHRERCWKSQWKHTVVLLGSSSMSPLVVSLSILLFLLVRDSTRWSSTQKNERMHATFVSM